MSWPERQAEYLRDMKVLDGRRPYVEAAMKKKLKRMKSISFPYTEVMEVSTKHNNRYLWFIQFLDKRALKLFNYQEMMFALIQGARGIYVYGCFDHCTLSKSAPVVMFAPHFFSRYAKRTHQTFADTMECRKTFLLRNFPCVINKGTRLDENGETEYTAFAPCSEGVGLGNYDTEYEHCVLLKTFISHEMLKGNQSDAVSKGLFSINRIKEEEQKIADKRFISTTDMIKLWTAGK